MTFFYFRNEKSRRPFMPWLLVPGEGGQANITIQHTSHYHRMRLMETMPGTQQPEVLPTANALVIAIIGLSKLASDAGNQGKIDLLWSRPEKLYFIPIH